VSHLPIDLQILNALAALLLLLSFAMLAQRRIVTLVDLLALQGAILSLATLLLARRTGASHLFVSAALTFVLKVVFMRWLLRRLIRRLGVYWDSESLLNPVGTMLMGLLIVIFAFGLAQPISALASTATRSSIGIAVAVILISFLMMITRRKATSQVVGFLHHLALLAALHAHRGSSWPRHSRAAAALSQHVPAVHGDHADCTHDQ
jgi:hydrogenase-4 component E